MSEIKRMRGRKRNIKRDIERERVREKERETLRERMRKIFVVSSADLHLYLAQYFDFLCLSQFYSIYHYLVTTVIDWQP